MPPRSRRWLGRPTRDSRPGRSRLAMDDESSAVALRSPGQQRLRNGQFLQAQLGSGGTPQARSSHQVAHYGAVALPCRVGDPDRKGTVESAIRHTQAMPSKGCALSPSRRAPRILDRCDAQWA
jgi:hypothetical protein